MMVGSQMRVVFNSARVDLGRIVSTFVVVFNDATKKGNLTLFRNDFSDQ